VKAFGRKENGHGSTGILETDAAGRGRRALALDTTRAAEGGGDCYEELPAIADSPV
jgi:hypothetical protein